jgi:hypothetical protein
MPYCPKCQYEYLDEVTTCPQCEVDLVAELEARIPSDLEYVEIYTISNRMEADLICGILKENQVEFLVRDLRSFPVLPDFGRRARLRIAVATHKENQARKLLQEAKEDGALTDQGNFL